MIYLVLLFILLLLSFIYDINGKVKNRDFWYNVMLVVFILIAGLRWRLGLDTPNYLGSFYYTIPTLDVFSFKRYGIGEKPLWFLLNSVVKTLGLRFYVIQLIHATIVNVLIFKYIKKHSSYIFTCLFFYFTCFCYTEFNMEIMKGSLSIAICLFANDYVLEKKWIKGYMLYLLAFLFHPQTLIVALLPTLYFLRLNKMGLVFILGAFIFGYVAQSVLGEYLDMLEMLDEDIADRADTYVNSDKFGGQIHSSLYILVLIVPWLFYGIVSLWYSKRHGASTQLLQLEPFIILGAIFMVAQMNMHIAYRFVDYFRIYYIIFFAELFVNMMNCCTVLKKNVLYTRAIIIFIPLFLMVGANYYRRYKSYYPYSSVIERKIDTKREARYMRTQDRPHANRDRY